MYWFNIYGLIVIVLFMIPNILFSIFQKEQFENAWKNKAVELGEQIGRYGCFFLMIFNIPKTWFGFWFDGGFPLYLAINYSLTAIYCGIWAVCFKKNNKFRALSLSILPSLIFLFSGIMLINVPLILAAILFAPCHITISYKNAVLSKNHLSLND